MGSTASLAAFLASAAALLALLALAISAWGWGRLLLRACRMEEENGHALAAALGLALLAAAGGVLNLAHAAVPPALWALLAAGWAFALRAAWTRPRPPATLEQRLHAGAIALVAAFLGFSLLPGAAFNPYDDFQLYFPRIVRMLQTGTLSGNPFDPIGFDSLGGHAFLQAFTLLGFPLQYMNALDGVLAPVLALALVAAAGRALRLDPLVTAGAMAFFVLVPPQQVNTSPVYMTTLLSLALVPALAAHLAHNASWRSAAPAGLLLAALVGAKVTIVAFLFPMALAWLFVLGVTEGWRVAMRSAAFVASWAAIFLAPWLIVHADHYAAWLQAGGAPGYGLAGNPSVLLVNLRLPWGGTVMAYNAVALVAAAAAVAAWSGLRRLGGPERAFERRTLLALLALCDGTVAAYLINTFPYDVHHAIRYSAPVLIAAAAASVLAIGLIVPRARARLAAAGLAACAAVLLAGATLDRARRAVEYRTVLAYPAQDLPQFVILATWGLSGEVREWVLRAQATARPGERILALIACPYDLLFVRNPIFAASEFGLSSPWIRVPLDANAEEIRAYLRGYGVRYVIWQVKAGMQTEEMLRERLTHSYPADRRLALNLLSIQGSLGDLSRTGGGLIHFDDGLVVVDLDAAPGKR